MVKCEVNLDHSQLPDQSHLYMRGQGPLGLNVKWPSIYSSHCHHVCVGQGPGSSRNPQLCHSGTAPPDGESWTVDWGTIIVGVLGLDLHLKS